MNVLCQRKYGSDEKKQRQRHGGYSNSRHDGKAPVRNVKILSRFSRAFFVYPCCSSAVVYPLIAAHDECSGARRGYYSCKAHNRKNDASDKESQSQQEARGVLKRVPHSHHEGEKDDDDTGKPPPAAYPSKLGLCEALDVIPPVGESFLQVLWLMHSLAPSSFRPCSATIARSGRVVPFC